jgi:hypothetical protein
MKNQSTQMGNPWNVLAGVLFILGICAAQSVMADGNETFTNASLQGTYAYANSVSGVASLGPITFDGHGGLTAKIKVNLPCAGDEIARLFAHRCRLGRDRRRIHGSTRWDRRCYDQFRGPDRRDHI